MKTTSKILLLVCGLLLASSIFLPIWRIELDAPQYPEGLALLIYANKLGGDVEIINGLNHYIGMATLHAENFIEFTVLPYIIGAFALISILVGVLGKRSWLYILFGAFALFGVVAMVDFWRWEYNYGHNLDPSAAIIVPGMAYQPPLIGFKQLLNFGAYSIPDLGGWMFIASGVFMLVAVSLETGWLKKWMPGKKATKLSAAIFLFAFTYCSSRGPEPIKLNKDDCDFCKMTLVDGRFGAELITKKGRAYKFDDLSCLVGYVKENKATEVANYYIHNYMADNELIDATTAIYLESDSLHSPMGGNTAAFKEKADAEKMGQTLGTTTLDWEKVKPE